MLRFVRAASMLVAAASAAGLAVLPTAVWADEQFMNHASFNAHRSHQQNLADPQVFVADSDAPEIGKGTLGIEHAAGFRPARPTDTPSQRLYNAQGNGLSLSLGRWFDARGTAKFLSSAQQEGNGQVALAFTGLIPFGVYSLFVSRSTPDGTIVAPFSDATDTMKASIDGYLALTASPRAPLTGGDVLLLVYHSDGAAHGSERGELGVTAHEQLILPVKLAQLPVQPDEEQAPTVNDQQHTPDSEPHTPVPSAEDDGPPIDQHAPSTRQTPVPVATTAPKNSDGEPTF